jgi:molybdopterin converting factor small subunit
MAQITVSLYAGLRALIGGKRSVGLALEPGQTVGDVLDRLGVPRDQTRIFFVNSRHAGLSDVLHDGDHVAVFPAIGGG